MYYCQYKKKYQYYGIHSTRRDFPLGGGSRNRTYNKSFADFRLNLLAIPPYSFGWDLLKTHP